MHGLPSQLYIYITLKEKASIYKSFQSKATKTQQVCHYRHVRKTSGLFLLHETGIGFSSHNNSGSLTKVSVPVQSITPCSKIYLATLMMKFFKPRLHYRLIETSYIRINTYLRWMCREYVKQSNVDGHSNKRDEVFWSV